MIRNEKYNPLKNNTKYTCIELDSLESNNGAIICNYDSSAQNSLKNKFYAGDVLFGKLRPYLRKYHYAESDGVCSSEIWVLYSYKLDSLYLYYYIQAVSFSKLANLSSGTKMPRADWNLIKINYIYYPNERHVQIKIGQMLQILDKRIQTQKKIIHNYESLIKVINNKHFSNIVPNHNFYELYKKAKEGGTPDTKVSSYYDNGVIPFIKIEDLNNKYIVKNNAFITEEGLNNSSAWIIPENSVLFSNGATIGAVSINRYPVSTKQGILGIVPNEMLISSEYMYYLIKSNFFKREINRITTKGTMDAAYLQDINSIICPIETIDIQKGYIKNINILHSKIENEKKTLSLLEKQKQYLLNKMFI